MTTEKISLGEGYEGSIAYEGVEEALGIEMARHNSRAHEIGLETPTGRLHLESMAALAEVRRHLSPNNPELLLVVDLMLKSGVSDRETTAA